MGTPALTRLELCSQRQASNKPKHIQSVADPTANGGPDRSRSFSDGARIDFRLRCCLGSAGEVPILKSFDAGSVRVILRRNDNLHLSSSGPWD